VQIRTPHGFLKVELNFRLSSKLLIRGPTHSQAPVGLELSIQYADFIFRKNREDAEDQKGNSSPKKPQVGVFYCENIEA
jgi:hypothetical protein